MVIFLGFFLLQIFGLSTAAETFGLVDLLYLCDLRPVSMLFWRVVKIVMEEEEKSSSIG